MKQGKSLAELAEELERRQRVKRDYVADTRTLSLRTETEAEEGLPKSKLSMVDVGEFDVNELAHEQIGGRLGVPKRFYGRLRESHPDLLDHNVNELFRREPEKRMVRTLDGTARAFLSDRYRRLDDFDVANAVLPILAEFPDMRVESCQVTERRLYIKAVLPKLEGEIKVGQPVQSGLVVSNSEVGQGALKVEPMIYVLACTNGMIVPSRGMQKYHVGRQIELEEEQALRLFRDETMRADDKAFFMKVEDIVRGVATEQVFQAIIADLRELTDRKLEDDPVESVQRLSNKVGFTDHERGNVLLHLIEGGDISQWGVVNAVTRASQDIESYERATELERIGGDIAAFSESEWKAVAVPS